MERSPEIRFGNIAEKFEKEIGEIKIKMENALAKSTSQKDAKDKIKEILPKDRSFLGPMVIYNKEGETRFIQAMVQTLNDNREAVNIEAFYTGQ